MITLSSLAPRFAFGWETQTTSFGTVALTFDDGPDASTTPLLLRMLDDLRLMSTMFVIGQKCKDNGSLLREITAAGHQIGCHGYVHRRHAFRKAEFVTSSIRQTQYVLEDLGVQMAPVFRPPYGAIDVRTHSLAARCGLRPVLWSAHVTDWRPASSLEYRSRLERAFHDRMILLLHDGHERVGELRACLEYFRDELDKRKWEATMLTHMKTLSEVA